MNTSASDGWCLASNGDSSYRRSVDQGWAGR